MPSTAPSPLRIATRGSPLALVQAKSVRTALLAAHPIEQLGGKPELVVIKTSGDHILDRPLRDVGGKGLFTREIENALLNHSVDLAVHSAKDMPTQQRFGLSLVAVLAREDARDTLISERGYRLLDLPDGARIGTTSLRRQAQLKRKRPDLVVQDLRGNVETRLRKLQAGDFDAIVLAAAGLNRLALPVRGLAYLDEKDMVPAAAQGAIGIEIRSDDPRTARLLAPLNHPASFAAIEAERLYLSILDGSCHSPIGGHLKIAGDYAEMRGIVLSPDGRQAYEARRSGHPRDAIALAKAVAQDIRAQAPQAFIDAYLTGI